MARRSRMSILKRQRELKKAEKAAQKRAKRHGIQDEFSEPTPTFGAAAVFRGEGVIDPDTGNDDGPGGADGPDDAPAEKDSE